MTSNILIIMSDNRRIDTNFNSCDYNSLAATINYLYSKEHNYDFKYFVPHNNQDYTINNCLSLSGNLRHASWSKLLTTMMVISDFPKYDYIVYIDSDCIFNDFTQKIETYFPKLKSLSNNNLEESNIILLNDKPWHPNHPCAGFYVTKNNQNSIDIFKSWYGYDEPNNRQFDTKHCWEQSALHPIHTKYDKHITMVDDWMFEIHSDTQLLRHIGTHEKHNRLPHFKEKIRKLIGENNFEFHSKQVLSESVEYDTNTIIKKIYE